MSSLQVYNSIALVLSGIFALSAAVHLASPGFVRRAYERWNFARGFHFITGILELMAAAFLASPTTRIIWGVVLAATVLFSAVVTLLSNRQYAYTVPSLIMLIALAPVSLAGPI